MLRDGGIVPNSAKDVSAPLKLHTADLIFTQAARSDTYPIESRPNQTGLNFCFGMTLM